MQKYKNTSGTLVELLIAKTTCDYKYQPEGMCECAD